MNFCCLVCGWHCLSSSGEGSCLRGPLVWLFHMSFLHQCYCLAPCLGHPCCLWTDSGTILFCLSSSGTLRFLRYLSRSLTWKSKPLFFVQYRKFAAFEFHHYISSSASSAALKPSLIESAIQASYPTIRLHLKLQSFWTFKR